MLRKSTVHMTWELARKKKEHIMAGSQSQTHNATKWGCPLCGAAHPSRRRQMNYRTGLTSNKKKKSLEK